MLFFKSYSLNISFSFSLTPTDHFLDIFFLTDHPNQIAILENGVFGRVHDGIIIPLDSDNQAIVAIAHVRFGEGLSPEGEVVIHGERLQ